MQQSDLEYYAYRREQEIRLAARAASVEAASAHRMLAEIYMLEVRRLTAAPGTAERGAENRARGSRRAGLEPPPLPAVQRTEPYGRRIGHGREIHIAE